MADKRLIGYDQLNKLAKGIYGKLHGEVQEHTSAVVDALKTVNANIKTNKDAIDAVNNETTGILKQAKDYADGKDAAIAEAKKAGTDAQADVDALEGVVGSAVDGAEATTVFGKIAKAQAQADKGVADAAAARGVADQAAEDIAEMKNADSADSLAGKIKANKDAIDILNGTKDEAGSVAKAVAEAEGRVANKYATKDELGKANQAISKAQGDITNLAGKVGTVAEGKTIVQMIADAKTEATYDDTGLKGRVATIEADYLKTADKTALQGAINGVSERVTANANAIKTEKDRMDTFMASADIGGAALDTLKEIQDYITSDGEAAATMTQNIANNKAAIDAINKADTGILAQAKKYAEDQDEALHTLISQEIDADVKVVADDLDALELVVGDNESGLVKKVNDNTTSIGKLQSALGDVEKAASASALETVKGEVQDIKDEIGTKAAEGKAATGLYKEIANEADRAKKAEAGLRTDVDALKTTVGDASSGLVKDVAALKHSNHIHDNKEELDKFVTGDKGKLDTAYAKVTGNAATAGTIAEAKKAGDDAKTFAEGLKLAVAQGTDDPAKVTIKLQDSTGKDQSTVDLPYEFVTDADIDAIIAGLGKRA